MDKVKDNLPKTALALYIKLYCKKRGNKIKDKNILIEATKSWLALNKSDKQLFMKKYEEYQINFKKAFADYLKSAEPYLKVKKKKENIQASTSVIEENSTIQNEFNEDIELDTDQKQKDQNSIEINNIDNTVSSLSTVDDCNTNTPILENKNNTNDLTEADKISIEEPTPPKFITSQQLFEFMNENNNNLLWTKLSVTEKRKYYNAVLLIKKKYIIEYKNYLEHLSSENLYHHYKRTNNLCNSNDE
ncbi:uncharacterized protein LOC125071980 [Vanessa atalanta]|uniref:uncharacterized protein LOC125071980 n=1 Tax=Vanessa atalanta TaxID=42275 RepID=UPI001FCCD174|nr:uncharacterized protein LOC125071980 [Vanessa atalanta]